ncbi:MAG: ComF family protein [Fusobacteriaceae bacterium]|nr:ComF family protein [Fusobacteriaceae bacterium]
MKNLILSIRKFLFADTCVCCENRPDNKLHYLCRGCFNIILKEKSVNKIENTYYIWPYRSLFRKLLLEYKGNSILPLSHIISEIISDDFFNIIYNEDIDYIIPIPINYRREQSRGFNQVEEILKNLNYSYIKEERIKNTKKMFKILDEEKRKKNIENSFKSKNNFEGKNILIFDDIITTGATIDEFKKELLKGSKINKIIVFSLTATSSYIKKKQKDVLI